MSDTKYDNSGIAFRNDRKTRDSDRDYSGSATIAGIEYWVSGWVKEGKRGKFLTFSFKPKDAPKASGAVPYDDQVPFFPERRG
jgi:hypothetical protein